jgi:hypothetical protein
MQSQRIDEHVKPLPTLKPGNQASQSAAHRPYDQVHSLLPPPPRPLAPWAPIVLWRQ